MEQFERTKMNLEKNTSLLNTLFEPMLKEGIDATELVKMLNELNSGFLFYEKETYPDGKMLSVLVDISNDDVRRIVEKRLNIDTFDKIARNEFNQPKEPHILCLTLLSHIVRVLVNSDLLYDSDKDEWYLGEISGVIMDVFDDMKYDFIKTAHIARRKSLREYQIRMYEAAGYNIVRLEGCKEYEEATKRFSIAENDDASLLVNRVGENNLELDRLMVLRTLVRNGFEAPEELITRLKNLYQEASSLYKKSEQKKEF